MVLADGSPLPEGFALLPLTPHAHFWVFLGLQLGRAGACLASPPAKREHQLSHRRGKLLQSLVSRSKRLKPKLMFWKTLPKVMNVGLSFCLCQFLHSCVCHLIIFESKAHVSKRG